MIKEPMLYWGTTTAKQHGLVDKTSMIYDLKQFNKLGLGPIWVI